MVLLTISADTTSQIHNIIGSDPYSIWFWVSIGEFFVIILLLLNLKKRKYTLAFSDLDKSDVKRIKNTKTQSINMDNLMDNIHGSRKLYKELSNKCHPDRFVNKPEQTLANEIFQEITENKRNFEKLNEIKVRATNELNIKF